MNRAKLLENIKKNGVLAKGRRELIKHLKGERLTYKQAVLAQCYDCQGYYVDGKRSCRSSHCPLFQFVTYK